jgi:hypothetical protein
MDMNQNKNSSMSAIKLKRLAELKEFVYSDRIDPDKFRITVSDALLLLESQWEDYCAGSEVAFQIQRESDIAKLIAKAESDRS